MVIVIDIALATHYTMVKQTSISALRSCTILYEGGIFGRSGR